MAQEPIHCHTGFRPVSSHAAKLGASATRPLVLVIPVASQARQSQSHQRAMTPICARLACRWRIPCQKIRANRPIGRTWRLDQRSLAYPGQTPVDFSALDADENQRIISSEKMSFAMVGCSGDPETQTNTGAVADAITAANDTSFFYHLGDIVYIEKGSDATADGSEGGDTPSLWNSQFYAPYTNYPKRIVSVPGNHDGKSTPITNYLEAFCADALKIACALDVEYNRPEARHDPALCLLAPQYSVRIHHWALFKRRERRHARRSQCKSRFQEWTAVSVARRRIESGGGRKQPELAQESRVAGDPFPPHSGATNFNVRGDPSQGPTPKASNAPYLAIALQEAFTLSGQRPYAIFSAHAHLFQRITYAFNDGTVMPCLVAGCGGHSPLEELARMCSGESGEKLRLPFRAVTPGSFQFPAGDSAQVEYYQDNCSDDSEFGFLKLTFEARTLMCQFIGATSHKTLETSLSWTLTAVNTSNQVIARRAVPRPARDEAHHTSFTQPGSPVKG